GRIRGLSAVGAGAEGLRREGVPLDPARPGGREALPEAEVALHDREVRRLGRRHEGVLRPGHRNRRGDRARSRSAARMSVAASTSRARPVPRIRRGGGGLAVGLSTAYLSLMVLARWG